MSKQKTQAAITRLAKALEACSAVGLSLKSLPTKALQVGDHVLHEGRLLKIVARDSAHPGRLAFDDGRIVEVSANEHLVLRG